MSTFLYLLILVSPSLFATPSYPDLANSIDNNLQSNLKKSLHRLGLSKPAKNKKLALTLVDITDEDNPKVAAVNGTEMMYAASLPKIAILLGAFEKIENRKWFDETG